MNFEEFKKGIKLEGTPLDRRRKLSDENIKTIKRLYDRGDCSIPELAEKFDVSYSTIKHHVDSQAKELDNERHKTAYHKLSVEDKKEIGRRKQLSYNKYIKDLYYATMLNTL